MLYSAYGYFSKNTKYQTHQKDLVKHKYKWVANLAAFFHKRKYPKGMVRIIEHS